MVILAAEIVNATGESLPFVFSFFRNVFAFPTKLYLSIHRYHGRPPSAAPATGSVHRYLWEQEEYLSSLFGPKPEPATPKKFGHDKPGNADESKGKVKADEKKLDTVGEGKQQKIEKENFFNF